MDNVKTIPRTLDGYDYSSDVFAYTIAVHAKYSYEISRGNKDAYIDKFIGELTKDKNFVNIKSTEIVIASYDAYDAIYRKAKNDNNLDLDIIKNAFSAVYNVAKNSYSSCKSN